MKFIQIPGKDFEMADAPVTQSEYFELMGVNPSHFINQPDAPVESVNWHEANAFAEKLTERSGGAYIYSLPTEKQWEFFCRAGSKADYCFGDSQNELLDYAWFSTNAEGKTHPVKQKKPNSFGLYDMHGNVWEWTSSLRDKAGSDRVVRGGSWDADARGLRSAQRYNYSPGYRNYDLGFRLVRIQCPSSSDALAFDEKHEVKKLIKQIRAKLTRLEGLLR